MRLIFNRRGEGATSRSGINFISRPSGGRTVAPSMRLTKCLRSRASHPLRSDDKLRQSSAAAAAADSDYWWWWRHCYVVLGFMICADGKYSLCLVVLPHYCFLEPTVICTCRCCCCCCWHYAKRDHSTHLPLPLSALYAALSAHASSHIYANYRRL